MSNHQRNNLTQCQTLFGEINRLIESSIQQLIDTLWIRCKPYPQTIT
ncbi:Uncharacterised protein [Vibrio cholerae]|nr:Uncharacterised protein [Vibrio cholerae]CSB62736.1 Uncharacterised protein [Vibrio cholerae]CSB65726.1 Uncharacterised protein [Vibrio cholerae]CSC17605.1 Uncharacterised protein [Vibrio cholerae]CSC97929.1 Uncharacterised protein [Vibrio cholerae]